MPNTNPDVLNLSDDEFAKLNAPEVSAELVADTTPVEEPAEETETPEPVAVEEGTEEEPVPETAPEEPAKEEEEPVKEEAPPVEEKTEEEPAPVETKPLDKTSSSSDYESFYKQVMAPFKANGKTIQLQSADEVISLMQMGANYTKKMQAIQHGKKFLMMLENNGLLDENKLSFYIDLDKKDPEAIKKFLKDSNIDPVDMDTSGEVNYNNKSYAVTDHEVGLADAIEDLNSLPNAKETLQLVHAWDSVSKKALWENPELLATIHAQRENGIYTRISSEIERRKLIGQIPSNIPFLRAYKEIGDELAAQGVFQTMPQPATSAQPSVAVRTPVAIRSAKTPATKTVDSSKVRAAATTRASTRPAAPSVNVLAMSDEEFMKFSPKV
jgi:hypothetical protein